MGYEFWKEGVLAGTFRNHGPIPVGQISQQDSSKLRQRTTTSTDTPPRAGYNVALYSTGLSSTPGFQTSGTGRHSGISFST